MVEDYFKSETEILDELEDKPDLTLTPQEEQIIDNCKLGKKEEQTENPIRKINKPFSYRDLQSFTTIDNLKFYIGTGAKLSGMVSYFEEEYKEKLVLVRFVKLIDKDTDAERYKIYFFNETIPEQERKKVYKTIESEFYLYNFTTQDKKYIIFSEEKLELEDYHIRGTIVESPDYVDLGKYARIGFKKPLLFVNKAIKNEVKFQSHEQFFECFKRYNLTRKKLIDWIFTNSQGWVYEFPESFADVLISNLLASPDEFDSFLLPILINGASGCGKSTAEEIIYDKMGEIREHIDMTSSTMKGLIPSFRNPTDLKQGYLLDCKRLAFVDEFFQGLSNMDTDTTEKNKTIECIKNLLDYKLRTFASGQGTMKGKMRANFVAMTNPKGYGDTIIKLANHFPPENLARFFIWFVSDEQGNFIDKRKGNLKKAESLGMPKEEFLAGIDYLKTFNCEYDKQKVREIYKTGENFLKSREEFSKVMAFYRSRYFIHACRMIDSLIKLRVWTELGEFKAKQEDYEKLKSIWLEMLENWGRGFQIIDKEKP